MGCNTIVLSFYGLVAVSLAQKVNTSWPSQPINLLGFQNLGGFVFDLTTYQQHHPVATLQASIAVE